MHIRLLGPVEIETAGQLLIPPRRRERCLLGILLLEMNRLVPVSRLAELLWDGDPPDRARRAIHSHVSRLRGTLVAAGTDSAIELLTVGDGYRIEGDPQSVDVHRFRTRLDEAQRTADLTSRIDQQRAALDLWRGPPLANAASDWLRERICSDLQELYLAAIEDVATATLALRREREILPEIARVSRLHPGRESLIGLHMRALYQAGRKADALAVYDHARAELAETLGLDPGPPLRDLHLAILRDEVSAPRPPGGRSTPDAPRQLPASPPMFTGRAVELSSIDQMHDSSAAVVAVIDGMAGVGKTALAVHAAHRMAARYPDGQLFIDLHGFTSAMPPVAPADALDRLLRALGVPGERIPAEPEDRAALWRSALAGRRMLVMLDNAATESQVAPLLPGTAGCLVLVTSRRRLNWLDAAHILSLDTLPVAEAVTLFARTAGKDQLADDLQSVTETVELCGRLPLAIRIAAAQLRSHPSWQVTDLIRRLREHDQRLAELSGADGTLSVSAALDVSYWQLTADQQRVYGLLALHPGADIEPYAAAALADTDLVPARRILDQLLDVHLLQERTAGRYGFHDLVRAHAQTVLPDDAEPERRAALTRLLDHYRHAASAAMDAAYAYERGTRPRVPPATTPSPDLSDPVTAAAWLDTELPNLLDAARYAADQGLPEHTHHLSATLHRHLRTRGRYRDADILHQRALTMTRSAGDRIGEMSALRDLGHVHRRQGRYGPAIDHYTSALEIARTTGHRAGEVDALIGLGNVHGLQGRYEPAADQFGPALAIARTIGHRSGELDALLGLGDVHGRQARYERAASHHQRALAIARAIGHWPGELHALLGQGHLCLRQGQYEQAIDHHQQALGIARTNGHLTGEQRALAGLGHFNLLLGRYERATEHYTRAWEIARTNGHRTGELSALVSLGHVHRMCGRYEQAADAYRQVLDAANEIGNRNWQFEALHGLGRLHCTTGHADLALMCHQRALHLAMEIGQPSDQARAHDGLAHAHHALNQPEQAREHWTLALDVLNRLGTKYTEDPEADIGSIQAWLASLDRLRQPG